MVGVDMYRIARHRAVWPSAESIYHRAHNPQRKQLYTTSQNLLNVTRPNTHTRLVGCTLRSTKKSVVNARGDKRNCKYRSSTERTMEARYRNALQVFGYESM